ncbi:MAG: two-component regulator propeller domain-containing protein [Chitinophagaceae bacterium]
MWAATRNNGLYRIRYSNTNNKSDSNHINLHIKNFSDVLPDKNVYCLYQDSKSNIWVGTRAQGIAKLKYNGNDDYSVTLF